MEFYAGKEFLSWNSLFYHSPISIFLRYLDLYLIQQGLKTFFTSFYTLGKVLNADPHLLSALRIQ